jgi:hypothetical protein
VVRGSHLMKLVSTIVLGVGVTTPGFAPAHRIGELFVIEVHAGQRVRGRLGRLAYLRSFDFHPCTM